jgi:hypothetical protein
MWKKLIAWTLEQTSHKSHKPKFNPEQGPKSLQYFEG